MSDQRVCTPQDHTKAYLMMLGGKAKTPFAFRTFDDKKHGKNKRLSRNFTGTLNTCERALTQRNTQGAGIFAVVNEGGQTDDEITRVRAVFADTDGAPLQPILDALTPHFVVCSSPGNYHPYYLVDPYFPLARFTAVQSAIARKFGTDPSVKNLSRVMRVPGFTHNKGHPFLVFIDNVKPKMAPYSLEQIVDGLGLEEIDSPAAPNPTAAKGGNGYDLSQVEEMLAFIEPWDREVWMRILFALTEEYGEAARDLAVRWSRGALRPNSNLREPTR